MNIFAFNMYNVHLLLKNIITFANKLKFRAKQAYIGLIVNAINEFNIALSITFLRGKGANYYTNEEERTDLYRGCGRTR